MFPTGRKIAVPALLTLLAGGLAGCSSVGEFDETGGISAIRSACPSVEVAAVMQGGSAVVAKRVGQVTLHFDAGQLRASATATGAATVSKAAATLSKEVRDKLTEKRKAGDADAATDPLTRPDIRQAVARATFEALVGFQLTDDQLKYNATR
jgi:hypothetical protein